jgi:hypothetical protein
MRLTNKANARVVLASALIVGIIMQVWLLVAAAVVGCILMGTREVWLWVGKGYVKQSELDSARDRALRKRLAPPGRNAPGWHAWAKTVTNDVFLYDPLPGRDNHAIFPYLVNEHDAERMDELLTERIWPRPELCVCVDCPRNERRPWVFLHDDSCPASPNFTDPTEVCCCIEKRRKGKVKTYRSIKCPIHGKPEDVVEDEEQEYVEVIEGMSLNAKRMYLLHNSRGHPLGPPFIDGFVRFEGLGPNKDESKDDDGQFD